MCIMQHMRNSAIILVALSAASVSIAAAEARSEEQIVGNDNDPDCMANLDYNDFRGNVPAVVELGMEALPTLSR